MKSVRSIALALAAAATLSMLPLSTSSAGVNTTVNPIGRLTSAGTQVTRVFYEYDANGRATATQFVQDGQSRIFRKAYGYPQNPDTTAGPGYVVSRETFPDGEEVTYVYDASGKQVAVRTALGAAADDVILDYRRNARGQTTRIEYGNRVITTFEYDEAGDLNLTKTASVNQLGTKLQEYGYQHDGNGNVTATSDGVRPELSATYTYDELDQLTAMLDGSGAAIERYKYDNIGNLTEKGALIQTYGGAGVPPHGIAAAGGFSYTYDANGNVTAIGTATSITWTPANMAARVTAGNVISDKSYMDGSLWKKVEQGVTTYYAPSLRIENGVARKYYGVFAERLEQPGARELRFYQADHLGSSSVMTDRGGTVIRRAAYLPWGSDRAVDAVFTPKLQFNFKEKDATGFYDYGARLYNPVTGRWLSPDPSLGDGPNRYAYVRNNPISNVDPTGYKAGWYKFVSRGHEIWDWKDENPGGRWIYVPNGTRVVVHKVYDRDGNVTAGSKKNGVLVELSAGGVANVIGDVPIVTSKRQRASKPPTIEGINAAAAGKRLSTPESRLIQNIVAGASAINVGVAGFLMAAGNVFAIPTLTNALGQNAGIIAIDEASPYVLPHLKTIIGGFKGIDTFLEANPGLYNTLRTEGWTPMVQERWMAEVARSGSQVVNVGGNYWTQVELDYFARSGIHVSEWVSYSPPVR